MQRTDAVAEDCEKRVSFSDNEPGTGFPVYKCQCLMLAMMCCDSKLIYF